MLLWRLLVTASESSVEKESQISIFKIWTCDVVQFIGRFGVVVKMDVVQIMYFILEACSTNYKRVGMSLFQRGAFTNTA